MRAAPAPGGWARSMAPRPGGRWRSLIPRPRTTSWTRFICSRRGGRMRWTAGFSPRWRWVRGLKTAAGHRRLRVDLPGAVSTGDLTIRMYSPYALNHQTAVSLNGASIGTATWSGIGWTEAGFSNVALLEGENTVSLLCEGALDKTAVDWFSVDYERGFEAEADSLKFSHLGGYRYRISGFSTNDAGLYDITQPSAVKRVVNGVIPRNRPLYPGGRTGRRRNAALPGRRLGGPQDSRGRGQGPRLQPGFHRKCRRLDSDHPPRAGLA